MSTPTKTVVLRAILPIDPSFSAALTREGTTRIESDTLTLSFEKMTTETIVGRIKGLTKLRDEITQVTRQLNIPRETGAIPTHPLDLHEELNSIRGEIDDARGKYQEVQVIIDGVQKRIDDFKKVISELTELSRTGFTVEQLESEVGDFRRFLGRVPVKKLEGAQKALQTQLRDQTILAIGSKGKESAYILVATPKDKSSVALQTLLLYDFSQVEIPELKSSDPKSEIDGQEDKLNRLTTELEDLKQRQDEVRKTAGRVLNRRLDEISDSLILLRGALKLGEGAQASRVYYKLEKPLPATTMNELTKKGIVELETLS